MAKKTKTIFADPQGHWGRSAPQLIAEDAMCNLDDQYETSAREFKSNYGADHPRAKYKVTVTVERIKQ